ncbi:MAG TPA: hypothetical protein VMV72_03925 [Verrucomicrobiae bacterium]|nr:hypothetical protein [Verrucomicrobiae bacterium]
MQYADTLGTLLLMLAIGCMIGWRVGALLPWRLRAESRLLLSPLIGLAVLLHAAVLLGWIGNGYHQPLCLAVTALLVGASVWGRRDLTEAIKNILLVACFSVVTTAGVLYPVWRYGALSLYNDAFTYLVHGQWLQTHGFAHRAVQSGNYPAATQVLCYQVVGMRMGASFLLAYVQALMGATWSYRVYAAVVAMPVVLGGLSVAAASYYVCRRLVLSLLCGAAVGLTLNGLTYGASNGFLPQTWGLAFVVGSLVLMGGMLRHLVTHPGTGDKFTHWIPVSFLLSAAIHCYSEILPFLAASLVLVFLAAAVPLRRQIRRLVLIAGRLALLCLSLVNLEMIRVAQSLRSQVSAVVGMAVDWHWWQFASLSMGLRTGAHDVNVYLLDKALIPVACIALAGLMVAGLLWSCRRRGNIWSLVPQLAFLSLVVLAFAYFRWIVPSPWPTGTGQSWSQFKLSNWASPAVFCLLSVGIAVIAHRSTVRSFLLSIGLTAILAVGFARHVRLAEFRTHPIREDSGLSVDPVSAFFRIRQFAGFIPQDDPIYLSTGERKVGARQMLMYALMDHAVAGNWGDDAWVRPWLVESERDQPIERCRWMASMDSWIPTGAHRAGNLWLGSCPRTSFVLQSSAGGYPREQDQTGWWQWTARQLHFTCLIRGEQPRRVVLSFTYLPVGDRRPVHLSVGGKTVELVMEGGWHDWTSPTIELDQPGPTIEVAFDCETPPVKLSEQDPREASYLIKNLALHRVDE